MYAIRSRRTYPCGFCGNLITTVNPRLWIYNNKNKDICKHRKKEGGVPYASKPNSNEKWIEILFCDTACFMRGLDKINKKIKNNINLEEYFNSKDFNFYERSPSDLDSGFSCVNCNKDTKDNSILYVSNFILPGDFADWRETNIDSLIKDFDCTSSTIKTAAEKLENFEKKLPNGLFCSPLCIAEKVKEFKKSYPEMVLYSPVSRRNPALL